MSLGLKTRKIWRYHLSKDDQIQFFVAEEVSDYITLELQSIGKASIQLIEYHYQKGSFQ